MRSTRCTQEGERSSELRVSLRAAAGWISGSVVVIGLELKPIDRVFAPIRSLGEINMSKDFLPPTEAEEYRNTAEILRDLAEQVRFGNTRNELVSLADNLDRMAGLSERQVRRG